MLSDAYTLPRAREIDAVALAVGGGQWWREAFGRSFAHIEESTNI